jgi:hypothetical protein
MPNKHTENKPKMRTLKYVKNFMENPRIKRLILLDLKALYQFTRPVEIEQTGA